MEWASCLSFVHGSLCTSRWCVAGELSGITRWLRSHPAARGIPVHAGRRDSATEMTERAASAAQLMSTGATTAQRARGRWQLCRSSFRYPVVSVRETGIWQAPRVLGRPDLKGLPRNDCGRQRRSLTSTPTSPVVSVEHIDASSRQERTHDQERLSLHRFQYSRFLRCDHRRLSTARSRPRHTTVVHSAESARVPPEGCPKARIVVGACAQWVYWVGPARVQSGRCKGRGQIRSALGRQRL